MKKFILILVFLFPQVALAFCYDAAGAKYHIDPLLIKSLAKRESNFNPKAINQNKGKNNKVISTDYGLMQINSTHIPALISIGVIKNKDELLNNPCLNVQIGSWILAKHLKQCGVNWMCLGSYNAGFHKNNGERRMDYAKKIYKIYIDILRQERGVTI
jgi:soluble lytic murein transglycosylase-like protein